MSYYDSFFSVGELHPLLEGFLRECEGVIETPPEIIAERLKEDPDDSFTSPEKWRRLSDKLKISLPEDELGMILLVKSCELGKIASIMLSKYYVWEYKKSVQ